MKRKYFTFELKAFLLNPKNIGLIILTIILALYFGLISAPNHHVIESVDYYKIRSEYRNYSAFLKHSEKEIEQARQPGMHYTPSDGAVAAVKTYPQILKDDRMCLKSIKTQNWRQYVKYSMRWHQFIDYQIFYNADKNFLYPREYSSGLNYILDGHHGYSRTVYFYRGLLKSKANLNQNVIEERTALQRLQQSLQGWTVLVLLITVCFFAADVVTNDQKYRTVLKNIPLGKGTILWLKTAVVEVVVFFDFVLAFLVTILCLSPRYGLGSLNLQTTYYTGQTKVPFVTLTLGQYFCEFLMFALIIVLIAIRLTILLSLIFRNDYVAGSLSSLLVVSAKVLYFSSGMGYVYPFLKKLPMTYFTIGDSLTGNLAYLMSSPNWGFEAGILSLLICLAIIEICLLLSSKSRHIPVVR